MVSTERWIVNGVEKADARIVEGLAVKQEPGSGNAEFVRDDWHGWHWQRAPQARAGNESDKFPSPHWMPPATGDGMDRSVGGCANPDLQEARRSLLAAAFRNHANFVQPWPQLPGYKQPFVRRVVCNPVQHLALAANKHLRQNASEIDPAQNLAGHGRDAGNLENKVKISNFLAPAYATVALGIDYKPNKKWSFVVAPLSGKLTLVNDPDLEGNYGVKPGHIARIEMGALVNASVNTELVKNVDLISDITLFSNYLYHPEKIDVNWKVAVNMKINDYLSALVNTQLIYDADIIDPVYNVAKVQFKELFGVGLNFKF